MIGRRNLKPDQITLKIVRWDARNETSGRPGMPHGTRSVDKPRCMTVPEFARLFRIGRDKVHTLIRNGELAAVNVAAATSTRPRFVIRPEDIEAFVARRSVVQRPPPPRRRPRPRPTKEWF